MKFERRRETDDVVKEYNDRNLKAFVIFLSWKKKSFIVNRRMDHLNILFSFVLKSITFQRDFKCCTYTICVRVHLNRCILHQTITKRFITPK